MEENIRNYNVGASDYSGKSIQPWDTWEYLLDGWRCDISKRLMRTKKASWYDRIFHPLICDSRLNDFRKIKHILLKIKQLQDDGYTFKYLNTNPLTIEVMVNKITEENKFNELESTLFSLLFKDPNNFSVTFRQLLCIKALIKQEAKKPKYLWYKICFTINKKLKEIKL